MKPIYTQLLFSCMAALAGCVPAASEANLPIAEAATTGALTVQPADAAVTVKQLFASDDSIYALKSDGTLWAWGSNASGKLGVGDNTARLTPTQITALTGVSSVAAGNEHACAIATGGVLWCSSPAGAKTTTGM